jgi:hypothetical protein
MLRNTDKAYIAGIIDGEGCIDITSNSKGFSSHISVEMGCKIIPAFLFRVLKGSLKLRRRKDRNLTMFTWYITSQRAVKILHKILPYLKLKKNEARLLIKFQNTIKSSRVGNRYYKTLSKKTILKRLEYIKQLRELKRKDMR